MIVLNEGECGGKHFRVTFKESINLHECSDIYTTRVQIRRKFLFFKWFVTIKEWEYAVSDDDSMKSSYNERQFIINEADELFDKITNPYGA